MAHQDGAAGAWGPLHRRHRCQDGRRGHEDDHAGPELRSSTTTTCKPKHKPLPIFFPCTASVHLALDVFDGMPDSDSKPLGFPGTEETSQKIKYNYGNYNDFLLTGVHARPTFECPLGIAILELLAL